MHQIAPLAEGGRASTAARGAPAYTSAGSHAPHQRTGPRGNRATAPPPPPLHASPGRRGTAARHYRPPLGPHGGVAPVTTGKGRGCPLYTRSLSPPLLSTGNVSEELGDQPDPASLPPLPMFTPTGGPPPGTSGLDLLAAAAVQDPKSGSPSTDPLRRLHAPGPYNPAAILAPKAVKKTLTLEFVEMSELRGDVWPDDTPADTPAQRRPAKPPVITIKSWLECYSRMAAVLVSRFPEKAPELWAYQCTIMKAAHDYDGANWVAYDRLFRRDMLARKDLNWSVPNTRLYNEAFTGRARSIPRCPHCLADDHGGIACPHNPNPPVLGWLQGSAPLQLARKRGDSLRQHLSPQNLRRPRRCVGILTPTDAGVTVYFILRIFYPGDSIFYPGG